MMPISTLTAARRHRRGAERGLTLIETIVTVAILAVGVVGVAGGLAATERISTVNQSQSQLEVAMRQFSDWARTSPSTPCTSTSCPALPYTYCASSAAGGAYAQAVQNALAANSLHMPGVSPSIGVVYLSKGATRTVGSQTLATSPLQRCSGTCPGASCVGDWGVQEIRLTVVGEGSSLTRTIWKSRAW